MTQMGANEKAQKVAEKAGQPLFQWETVTYWPACVACGQKLRDSRGPTPSSLGGWRSCDCPGVLWRSSTVARGGWERVQFDADGSLSDADR